RPADARSPRNPRPERPGERRGSTSGRRPVASTATIGPGAAEGQPAARAGGRESRSSPIIRQVGRASREDSMRLLKNLTLAMLLVPIAAVPASAAVPPARDASQRATFGEKFPLSTFDNLNQ